MTHPAGPPSGDVGPQVGPGGKAVIDGTEGLSLHASRLQQSVVTVWAGNWVQGCPGVELKLDFEQPHFAAYWAHMLAVSPPPPLSQTSPPRSVVVLPHAMAMQATKAMAKPLLHEPLPHAKPMFLKRSS